MGGQQLSAALNERLFSDMARNRGFGLELTRVERGLLQRGKSSTHLREFGVIALFSRHID